MCARLTFANIASSYNILCCLPGSRAGEFSALEASSSSSICCNHQSEESVSPGSTSKCGEIVEQLAQARKLGILEQSPADEVEGELVFFQQQLLHNSVARKLFSGLSLTLPFETIVWSLFF